MPTNATIDEQAAPNDGQEAVETHPEEVPTSDEVPTYGERNRDLPEQLKNALTQALKDIGKQEMFDRRREVMRDRRNRYYRRGFQHIYEQRGGGFAVGVAGETITTAEGSFECSQYIGDYNIYRPTLMVIESVLTQNPPGIDFRPKTQKTEDLEAARHGRNLPPLLRPIEQCQRNSTRHLRDDGQLGQNDCLGSD